MVMWGESRSFFRRAQWIMDCLVYDAQRMCKFVGQLQKGIVERALLRSRWQCDHSPGTLRSDSGLRSLTLMLCMHGN